MAGNIHVRHDGDGPQQRQMTKPSRSDWEAPRIMRALLAWDPFRELTPLQSSGEQLVTAFDVKDTPEAFVFQADVPGLQEKDIEVELHGNRLTIRGKRESEREEPGQTHYAYERSFGSFVRSFTLPDGVDTESCNAALKDGVLTVTVPKKAKEQPRTIAINKPQSMKS